MRNNKFNQEGHFKEYR